MRATKPCDTTQDSTTTISSTLLETFTLYGAERLNLCCTQCKEAMKLKTLPHEIESLNIKLLSKKFFIVHFRPVVFKIPLLEKFAFTHFFRSSPSCNCTLYPDSLVTVFSVTVISVTVITERLCIVP